MVDVIGIDSRGRLAKAAVGVVAACASCATGCSSTSSVGAEPQKPLVVSETPIQPTGDRLLLAQVMKAAVAAGPVHIESVFTRGTQRRTFSQDTSIEDGRQVIRFGSIHAEVIQIGRRAYLTGNGEAMVRYFGFPASQRDHLAGEWVALKPSDSGWTNVTADVTLLDNLQEAIPVQPTTRTTSTVNGERVITLTGPPPGASQAPTGSRLALSVSPGETPLPVQVVMSAPDGTRGVTTFSDWGKPLRLHAPRDAIPVSSIAQ